MTVTYLNFLKHLLPFREVDHAIRLRVEVVEEVLLHNEIRRNFVAHRAQSVDEIFKLSEVQGSASVFIELEMSQKSRNYLSEGVLGAQHEEVDLIFDPVQPLSRSVQNSPVRVTN